LPNPSRRLRPPELPFRPCSPTPTSAGSNPRTARSCTGGTSAWRWSVLGSRGRTAAGWRSGVASSSPRVLARWSRASGTLSGGWRSSGVGFRRWGGRNRWCAFCANHPYKTHLLGTIPTPQTLCRSGVVCMSGSLGGDRSIQLSYGASMTYVRAVLFCVLGRAVFMRQV
jgi:hypothetical protein